MPDPNKEVDPNQITPPAGEGDAAVGLPPAADTTAALEAAAAEAAPAEGADETATEPELQYATYEDENANAAMSLLKDSGVKASEAREFFKEALETRDISKINYADIEKRIGKEKTSLLRLALTQYYNSALASVNEKVNAVFDTLGSKDNWVKVNKWAKAKADADPEFKKQVNEYNKMLDLNAKTAKAAAAELKELYEADPANGSLEIVMEQGDKGGSTEQTQHITRAEYVEQMKAAHAKGDAKEIERLRNLRTASRGAGY